MITTIVACSVDGCTTQIRTRRMCEAHYFRWRRHGDVWAHNPVATWHRYCAHCGMPVQTVRVRSRRGGGDVRYRVAVEHREQRVGADAMPYLAGNVCPGSGQLAEGSAVS